MSAGWPSDRATRWSRRVVSWAGAVVPARVRAERLMEWEAGLWELRTTGARSVSLLLFLAGVWWDALWSMKEGWRMDSTVQDVRYALRTLARSPGFAAAAVLTLALSIGASTALFSVVKSAIMSDPPYPDPDRLVVVDMLFGAPGGELTPSQWSYPRYEALRESVSGFEDLAAYGSRTVTLTELGDPSVVQVEVASASLFPLLGVTAQRGRVFGPAEDDVSARTMVALVSDAFWRTRMGAASDAVGTVITLDRLRLRVIGVVSEGYDGVSGNAELWIPFAALRELEGPSTTDDAWNQHFYVLGRIAAGSSLERVRSEVAAFGATVMERFPPPPAARLMRSGGDVVPLKEARSNAAARTSMIALFAAVILVLLIATANLAGLLLARGASRQREAAVRASLGAGRARLVRQLLTESLVLAVVGGALGVGLASVGVDVLGRWLAESLGTGGGRGLLFVDPDTFTIDWRVYLFALVLTAGVGLAFGLLPAWQGARTNPGEWLRGGRAPIGAWRSRRGGGRSLLMAGQVALAVVLLSAASLMMRTTVNLQKVDVGFDGRRLLTAMYSLSPADEQAGVVPGVFHAGVVERMRTLPGVTAASIGEVPLGGPTRRTIVMGSEGRPEMVPTDHVWIRVLRVADGYLSMLGARLIEGRDIEATDDASSEK
ncbi:MAG: ABC transporter permease, partial [Gemmatimonadota bacterium]